MLLFSIFLLLSRAKGKDLGCGVRPVFEQGTQHSRIIAGTEAEVGEFPWQVSIQSGTHYCGGSILSSQWILTAAHCVSSEMLVVTDLKIVMGTNDLTSSFREERSVTSIIYPKNFQRDSLDNDIALLLLSSPITFSDLVVPICMPTLTSPSKWHECWVAGWGQTKTGDKYSMTTDMMKVPMVIMDREKCTKVFPKLTNNMLCARYDNKTYDSCQGDSGGPLVCTQSPGKKWYQVGIISWGRSCGEKNIPGIYTLLVNYIHWIDNVTQQQGSPLDSKIQENVPKEKPADSRASESPPPACLRFWLLLCLLFFGFLFGAISC